MSKQIPPAEIDQNYAKNMIDLLGKGHWGAALYVWNMMSEPARSLVAGHYRVTIDQVERTLQRQPTPSTTSASIAASYMGPTGATTTGTAPGLNSALSAAYASMMSGSALSAIGQALHNQAHGHAVAVPKEVPTTMTTHEEQKQEIQDPDYWDIDGRGISEEEWNTLRKSKSYKRIGSTLVGDRWVSTVWTGHSAAGECDEETDREFIFETRVFRTNDKGEVKDWAVCEQLEETLTRHEARHTHDRIVRQLNIRLDHDDTPDPEEPKKEEELI